MDVFACARCGAALTVPVVQVALPVHAHQRYSCELMPMLMARGTYAVDPEPSGAPWRRWEEVGPEQAAARGVFAPVFALSFGARGAVALALGDTRGTVLIPERCDGYCCGVDGRDGPNLACAQCGRPVATPLDDHAVWQAVWLDPTAVRRQSDAVPPPPPDSWDTLIRDHPGVLPLEPDGWWSPVWSAAVGAAMAHLLVASDGVPVAVPDKRVAQVFGRALRVLLPQTRPERTMALAGPGLPSPAGADILLVPRHPQSGETWQPPAGSPTAEAAVVPLSFDVWLHLAFRPDQPPLPATGRLPDRVLVDDYPWQAPAALPFHLDVCVLLGTLARLPEVRTPWLRAIYERLHQQPHSLGV